MDNFNQIIKAFPFQKQFKVLTGFAVQDGVVTITDMEMSVTMPAPESFGNISGVFSADKYKKATTKFKTIRSETDVVGKSFLIFKQPGNLKVGTIADFAEFPSIQELKNPENIFIQKFGEFFKDVDFVLPAASEEESRRYLNGICFDMPNSVIVATDGRRLAVREAKFSTAFENSGSHIIVPTCVFKFLGKLKKEFYGQEISAIRGDNHIQFIIGEIKITVALIDGTFPNWQRVVPDLSKQDSIFLSREAFLEPIKMLVSMKYDKGKIPFVNIFSSEISVKISDDGNQDFREEWGNYSARIGTVNDSTENKIKLRFNTNYILDALNSFDVIEIEMRYSTPLAPVVFQAVGQAGQIIIMPMKGN